MNLPNYFMADLGPGAEITATLVNEACLTLKRNRLQYLEGRTTQQMVALICRVGELWLEPESELRRLLAAEGPAQTGFSKETLLSGTGVFLKALRPAQLRAWMAQDFGSMDKLEQFQATDAENGMNKSSLVIRPELIGHVASGNLPNPAWHSLVCGLLLRSAQFMKCASGGSYLARLFAHSIRLLDAKAASCIEIAEWRGGTPLLEKALFEQADVVTATGGDAAVEAIRSSAPRGKKLVTYGHRVSFGFVSAGALAQLERVAELAARDICAWDQQGCLSPHVIYVETGSPASGELFAATLARALESRETKMPRGRLSVQEAGVIASRRSFYEIRAAHSEATRLWSSKGSTAWTVVFESEPLFQASCLNRFVYVKNARNLEEALQHAEPIRAFVGSVGLCDESPRTRDLVTQLARWGAARVCPLGQMQEPGIGWRHDGFPSLGSLVTWCDWEH